MTRREEMRLRQTALVKYLDLKYNFNWSHNPKVPYDPMVIEHWHWLGRGETKGLNESWKYTPVHCEFTDGKTVTFPSVKSAQNELNLTPAKLTTILKRSFDKKLNIANIYKTKRGAMKDW